MFIPLPLNFDKVTAHREANLPCLNLPNEFRNRRRLSSNYFFACGLHLEVADTKQAER